MIGVSGGLFSIAGALEQGVSKADSMALAVEKFSGVTGLSAHTSSQLIAVMEKYGIDQAKVTTIAAFAEKTLGKLNDTTGKAAKSAALLDLENKKLAITAGGGSATAINKAIAEQKAKDAMDAGAASTTKLTALDAQYGLQLVDSKGKVADFATELNQVADLWVNKAIPADQKATVAAQLLGKGYVALIPMLALGSKGIAAASAEADKMGLTLKSAQDVKNVNDFIAAQRDAKDAVSGLEVQLGLLVMPDLAKGLTAFTGYVSTHQDDIKQMFSEGLSMAEALGTIITGTVLPAISSVAGAATKVWGMIPAPLRGLIVQGAVADRTLKFFFGMSPVHYVVSLAEGAVQKGLGKLVGGIFTKGSLTNPMIVKDISGGLGKGPGGGPGGVASDATTVAEDAGGGLAVGNTGAMLSGGAAVVAGAALSVAAVAAVGAVAIDQYQQISGQANDIATQTAKWAPTASLADLLKGQAAVQTGVKQLIAQGGYNPLAAGGEGGLGKAAQIIAAAIDARTSHFGGTGGNVGQDVYSVKTKTPAQAQQLAADMTRGLNPTPSQITTELRNEKAIASHEASANASARVGDRQALASLGSTTMRGSAAIVAAIQAMQYALAGRFLLNSPSLTHVAVRDVNTSANIRGSLGPDRRIGGSNSSPVRS
jgi:hypothetical protein